MYSKISEGPNVILVPFFLFNIGVHLLWSFLFSFLLMEISLQAPKPTCKPKQCSLNGEYWGNLLQKHPNQKARASRHRTAVFTAVRFSLIQEWYQASISKQNVLLIVGYRTLATAHLEVQKLLKAWAKEWAGSWRRIHWGLHYNAIQCRKHFVRATESQRQRVHLGKGVCPGP